MKAHITDGGALVIQPEDSTEEFALNHWLDLFGQCYDHVNSAPNGLVVGIAVAPPEGVTGPLRVPRAPIHQTQ